MERKQVYTVWRIVLFSDGRGFALSGNPGSHAVYEKAKQDFNRQVSEYQREHGVRVRKLYGADIRRNTGAVSGPVTD